MDQLELNQAAMKEEVESMKAKMDQIFEFMQNLALKEKNTPPAVNENDATWPPYGLPPNYTPPIEGGNSTPPPLVMQVANENPPPQGAPTT
jgi:hypothetical protein